MPVYAGVVSDWRTVIQPVTTTPPGGIAWDWSTSNQPQAANTTSITSRMPSGAVVTALQTGSSDFYTNLNNTLNAASGRTIIDLRGASVPRVLHLNSFRLAGSSGSQTYAFGFFFPKLQGFIGKVDAYGVSQSIIQMDANSMTQAQLDALSQMTTASFSPNQMGLCRIDGSSSSPIFLAGVTFRADDQNPLTTVASDVPVTVPQSAPHQGVVIYAGSSYIVDRCTFVGAGKAMTSQPPFEHANVSVSKSSGSFYNCEFDGRRAAELNASQPRACSTIMLNNETLAELIDCWGHHSNVSRYAANDQNVSTTALSTTYRNIRCKWEQITNTKNDGRGGYTNATAFGWESSNARIESTDVIISQDNTYTDNQTAQDFQHTAVASVNPAGGRHTVTRGTFRNPAFPVLDGWVCFRIPTASHWYSDGLSTTLTVVGADGTNKQPYVYTGTWPPTQAQFDAAGVTKDTHYLVRTS